MIFYSISRFWVAVYLLVLAPDIISNEQYFNSKDKPFWVELNSWSRCSTSCGKGIQSKRVICARNSFYHGGPEHLKSDLLCNTSSAKPVATQRGCNLGDCNMPYIWEAGSWGACSQTCGASGMRTRDVFCNYLIPSSDDSEQKSISDKENCEQNKMPVTYERCNVLNCMPEWVPGKWGSCKPPKVPCGKGIQKRRIECKIVMADNTIKNSTLLMCYQMMRQSMKKFVKVPNWRFCEYSEQNKTMCLQETKEPAKIESSDLTVVQMRKAKRLQLQIGQKAYVIPWTRVVVKCPVVNFRRRNILWMHNNQQFRYKGRGATKLRIKVDRRGRLKVKRFQATDQGEWICYADEVQSSIIIKMRSPSAGFHDWAARISVQNEEMLNEDPKVILDRAEVVQWVKTDWSRCSRSCGGSGLQTRTVRCERLDTRFYHILNDSVCSDRMLPKPENQRTCQSPTTCPEWKLANADRNVVCVFNLFF